REMRRHPCRARNRKTAESLVFIENAMRSGTQNMMHEMTKKGLDEELCTLAAQAATSLSQAMLRV
ncbi:hypothetical protein ABFV55_15175, partial [Pseudomonas syringae]|uniref:hypothetical protein n=1 Tax=Pseudomonas syringae TaxID=317 RepID=UPI0034D96921